MVSWKEHLKEWLGYTRRERRSSFILLIIIIIITGIRYFVPVRGISIEKIPINLSELAVDPLPLAGIQVKAEAPQRQNHKPGAKGPLEINSCDSAALVALPGIGPVLSARIIKYRNLIGGFVSAEQLKEVYGLKEESYSLIKSRVAVDSSSVRKIKINSVVYKDLSRHPYLTKKEVSDIIKYRELKGRITGLSDIRKNNLITPENLKRIRLYLDFGN
jgi:DNA uptake protein ComE-like DNA-binding protein